MDTLPCEKASDSSVIYAFLPLLIVMFPTVKQVPANTRVRQYVMQVQEFIASGRDRKGMLEFDQSMTPELIKLIPRVENPEVVAFLVGRVASVDSPLALHTLERWATSKDPQLAYLAIKSCGSMGWKGVAPLLRIFRKGTQGAKVESVAQLLDRCQYRPTDLRVRNLLVKLLEDDDPALRQLATKGLYRIAVFWHADKDPGMLIYPEVIDQDALFRVCLATLDHDTATKSNAHILVSGIARGFLRANSREEQSKAQFRPDQVREMATNPNWAIRCCYLTFLVGENGTTLEHVAALADDAPGVRKVALRLLERKISKKWIPLIGAHCQDKRTAVRAIAVELLGKTYSADALPIINQRLNDVDFSVQAAAKLAIARIKGSNLKN